jgi:hypothetical protein
VEAVQEMSESELMGEMNGDQLVDLAFLSPTHPKVSSLSDLFERGQVEEMKY